MTITHAHANGATGEAALADALTSKNPVTRIMARASASTWVEGMARWLNDELRRPGANPIDVLHALGRLHVQTFASFAAQAVAKEGDAGVEEIFLAIVRSELREHMAMTRQREGFR